MSKRALQPLRDHVNLKDPSRSRRGVGTQNAEDLRFLSILHNEVAHWFTELTRKLGTDPREIDLSDRELDKLKSQIDGLRGGSNASDPDLYAESRQFWANAVDGLRERLDEVAPELGRSEENVRPEAVIASGVIAAWANEVIGDLDRRERNRELYVPELPIFRQIVADLKRAAREFPSSAAVQKNIVRGILGHHLLEDLDEHVLELREIAQALDPNMIERLPSPERDRTTERLDVSVASRFALYLVQRSLSAEGIPKNLRVLQTLLAERPGTDREETTTEELLRAYRDRWNIPSSTIKLKKNEVAFLRLTLEELDQNQRKHSGVRPEPKISDSLPQISVLENTRIRLSFPFAIEEGDADLEASNLNRLLALAEKEGGRLQAPWHPRPHGLVTSTGAGLYLANLAAAVVGWTLRIDSVEQGDVKRDEPKRGYCTFVLAKTEPIPGTTVGVSS